MNKVLNLIFERPVTTGMFFMMIMVMGIFAVMKIPLELNPKIELPRVSVSTSWYGVSSETMEANITSPIEDIASTVRGVKNISSESGTGSSMVNIEFQPEIDLTLATLELNEKLSTLTEQFPPGVIPSVSKYVPKEVEELRFMTWSIASSLQEATLKKIANDKIKPVLLSAIGVSDIKILGGLNRQIKILLNEKKMLGFGLSFDKVQMSLQNFDIVKNTGVKKNKNTFYPLIIRQEVNSVSEVENIPIKISDEKIINLGRIAEIQDGSEENQIYRRINGEPTITIEILKEPGKNILTTADNVEQKIQKLIQDLPEIKFRKVYDQSVHLRAELNNLLKQSLISFCGVFLVLLIFLQNLKSPLIILSAIFFSIITVILFFSFLKVSLNILTLSGLSLGIGMLVDNSIVVYENIEFHRKHSPDFKSAIKAATSEVSTPLIASTFTTAVVFIPFFFLPEELKQMFLYFGVGMGLSIIISLIFSLTFIPFIVGKFDVKRITDSKIADSNASTRLSTRIADSRIADSKIANSKINDSSPLPRQDSGQVLRGDLGVCHREEMTESSRFYFLNKFLHAFWSVPIKKLKFFRKYVYISKIYRKILTKILKFRKLVIVLSIWLLGIPLWLLPEKVEVPLLSNFYENTFGSDFFKDNKELFYKILGGSWYIFKSNVNQNDYFNYFGFETYLRVYLESEQGTDIRVLNEINKKVENLLSDYSKYLTTYTTTVYENYSSMTINFKDEYSDSMIPLVLKSNLASYFTEFGGVHASIIGYGQPFSAGASFYESSSHRIEFKGYNYKRVKDLAGEFKEKVVKNPRVENVDIDKSGWGRNIYEVVAEVNRKKISESGLSVADVLHIVNAQTGGRSILKNFLIKDERISFDVKFKGFEDFQMSDLLNVTFLDKTGKPCLMKDLISLKRVKALSSILREKQQYSRTVTLDFLGPYEYANEYINAVIKTIKLPFGYSIDTGYHGFFREEDKIAFAYMILAAIILVFMVTASLYESFKKPLIILLSVPMALIGLFLIYYFTDANFGKSGYAGLILLIGVAVNNAIVLIDYISKLIDKGIPIDEAITEGAVRRSKPIIMTTLTTIIGLLPFVIIGDQKSLWYGLSLSVIGGLISSTVMVLFVLPAMCRVILRK